MKKIFNLDYERSKRGLKRQLFLRIYSVRANPETGEWLTDPIPTGSSTTALEWTKQESTSEYHCTTYTPAGSDEVRALIMEYK